MALPRLFVPTIIFTLVLAMQYQSINAYPSLGFLSALFSAAFPLVMDDAFPHLGPKPARVLIGIGLCLFLHLCALYLDLLMTFRPQYLSFLEKNFPSWYTAIATFSNPDCQGTRRESSNSQVSTPVHAPQSPIPLCSLRHADTSIAIKQSVEVERHRQQLTRKRGGLCDKEESRD
jgi:hypothetical protein